MMRGFLTLLQNDLFYADGQLDQFRVTLAACIFVLFLIGIFMRFQHFAQERDRDWREARQRQGRASITRSENPWAN